MGLLVLTKGKVPCLFEFYKVGGISGHILANVLRNLDVEEHRGLGGNLIRRLDNGAFARLIYSLLVLTD